MIAIRKITVAQYRNYASATFALPSRITCITGPNGSGKTNLLDAIYYLCYTKSYFSSYQQYTAQKGTDGFRIDGIFEKNVGNGSSEREQITYRWQAGKKELFSGNVPYDKLSDHFGKYAAVMIAPDDMELINDGSELRRKWLDGILSQSDPRYLESLMLYQKLLLQRNAWLKQEAIKPSSDRIALEYYNGQMTVHGNYIFQQRQKFVEAFLPLLKQYYGLICRDKESVSLSYQSDLQKGDPDKLFERSFEQDLRMQRTTKGIHRDDCIFRMEDAEIRQFGSQGQKKTFLFSLKLAQYYFLTKTLGFRPILLLDDIFEKLDVHRIESLLEMILQDDFGQVVITDTDAKRVRAAFPQEADIDFIGL